MEDDELMANRNQDEKNEYEMNETNKNNNASQQNQVDSLTEDKTLRHRDYIYNYIDENTSEIDIFSYWRMYFYGIENVIDIILPYLLTTGFILPDETYNLAWDEHMNYGLVEVIGQYFKVITNQQDHHVRRFSTKVWDDKHEHGEKYYALMVKVLKRRELQESTNDEFSIALYFLLDILDGKIVFHNFNLPEFREYCIEAGHFYVGALILDDYVEQVETLDEERD